MAFCWISRVVSPALTNITPIFCATFCWSCTRKKLGKLMKSKGMPLGIRLPKPDKSRDDCSVCAGMYSNKVCLTVVRLDNVDREKLEQSKEFMNNLRYADLIILSGESAVGSLAEELSKKNGNNGY